MSVTAAHFITRLVARRVSETGPISFAEYMELALYSEPLGYYRRNVPGPAADYRTSPTLGPHFGTLAGRQLRAMWDSLDRPEYFRVMEAGAGDASLAKSVINSAPNEFLEALEWCFVEPLGPVEKLQRSTIAGLPGELTVRWVESFEDSAPADGVVLANEVLDNMPFNLFEVAEGGLHEIRVATQGSDLIEVPTPLAQDLFGGRAWAALEHLEPGDRFELRPLAEDWCRKAARSLKRGYLLIIDYGDTEPDIWLRHPSGTLATYRKEQLGFDPFEAPGEADITSHVNFSALTRAAIDSGLTIEALKSQREWLTGLGIGEIEQQLRHRQTQAEEKGDHAEALAHIGERSRTAALAHKGGLGDLLVLIAAKGSELPDPTRNHSR